MSTPWRISTAPKRFFAARMLTLAMRVCLLTCRAWSLCVDLSKVPYDNLMTMSLG